jgi:hypothetical protein
VPVNQPAVPYRGTELARLHRSGARLLAGIGGRPWASFGVVVRNQAARSVLTTQRGRFAPDPLRPPLELVRSPRGAVRRATAYPSRPYAGKFDSLVARGTAQSQEVAVVTTHRFRAKSIDTSWLITRRKRGRSSVDVLFPSWGREARIEAVLRDGQRVTLAAPLTRRRDVRMRNVAYFYVAGIDGGYVVVPVGHRRGEAHVLKPRPHAAAPEPGPTLAVSLARRGRFRRLFFRARIAPASSAQHADRVARRLGRPRRRRAS